MISPGAVGSAVVALQQLLTRSGYWTEQDGVYGPATEGQVQAYQRARGLPITGIADAATIAALRRSSSSATMPAVRIEEIDNMIHGIDVARYQDPDTAPWAGCSFGAVRLSYGGHIDPRAGAHVRRARSSGVSLLIGYGWENCAADAPPACEQARVMLAEGQRLEVDGYACDIEPLDWKHPDPADRVSAMTEIFLEEASTETPCGVYIARAEAARLHLPAWVGRTWLWLAGGWATVPAPWIGEPAIVQRGVVKGVDRDESRMSLASLRQVVTGT